ncbi:MAG TPA: YihY/virulence factor BrkB family protein [Candidatus Dormibacteraeota bacterium]|nr:YihY/virulence factor BrkB family protein [Candidatus Dormibacteraeota bacterium]
MRRRIERFVERVQQTTPVRVLNAFGESQASNFALALAFAGFMAMFPMILGGLSLVGLAIRDPGAEAHAQLLVLQLFPGSAQPELQGALHGVKQSAGWLGLVSIGGLVWSASSIFGTMEFALTEIFGTKQRDLVRQKLMGFVMMALLVVAIVVTVGINTLASFVHVGWVAWLVGFVAGAIVMVALLVLLYRFVPNRTFALREVLPGAVLAGILVEALSLVFPLYARFAGHFNTYGAQFGLFFLLATWFYLLSQLLLLGAVYNRYRMGEPAHRGLIASPLGDARQAKRPVEAIKEKQETPETPAPPRRRPRSIFQRVALPAAVALAVAGGLLRRRRRRVA